MDRFPRARAVIEQGLAGRAYPAASIDVGRRDEVLWNDAFGALTYDADAPACTPDTIFDLASLTKVIATTSIAMRHVAGGLSLEDPVSRWITAWRGDDRAAVTVRHLLEHASGLPAHVRFWETHTDREAILSALVDVPLDRPPGLAAVYSDPGFMLLGWLLEARGGAPLDAQFSPIARALGGGITFTPGASLRPRIAPTEIDRRRGRLLQGEVHDDNAAALGGVAAHAGLFGTAASVGAFARLVLRTFHEETPLGTPDTMRLFATPSRVPDSSRALGWDTMRPTSSCGTKMSPAAIGHTGFTGTSLWIDPERDLYVVWLTNRVHPTRENNQLAALRPVLHDAVGEDVS